MRWDDGEKRRPLCSFYTEQGWRLGFTNSSAATRLQGFLALEEHWLVLEQEKKATERTTSDGRHWCFCGSSVH
ncbi:hypothetical protein ACA910_009163 [Epithemia clementina (nom. ined.)]